MKTKKLKKKINHLKSELHFLKINLEGINEDIVFKEKERKQIQKLGRKFLLFSLYIMILAFLGTYIFEVFFK